MKNIEDFFFPLVAIIFIVYIAGITYDLTNRPEFQLLPTWFILIIVTIISFGFILLAYRILLLRGSKK